MSHKQVTIPVADSTQAELLIALLSELGFEGFEEREDVLLAYVEEALWDGEGLTAILASFNLGHTVETIGKKNWNQVWEAHFEPVVVEGFCTVRADFHKLKTATPHEIIITPKMSFGTGHHATTQLMMRMMQDTAFQGKSVFDFGTGTGILAILASQLGADQIVAIDNDEWSYENALENAERNGSSGIEILLGSMEEAPPQQFDVILANINRHILLHYMDDLLKRTLPGGLVLMSGLLEEDRPIITEAAAHAGFRLEKVESLNNWIALKFLRPLS